MNARVDQRWERLANSIGFPSLVINETARESDFEFGRQDQELLSCFSYLIVSPEVLSLMVLFWDDPTIRIGHPAHTNGCLLLSLFSTSRGSPFLPL